MSAAFGSVSVGINFLILTHWIFAVKNFEATLKLAKLSRSKQTKEDYTTKSKTEKFLRIMKYLVSLASVIYTVIYMYTGIRCILKIIPS